MVANSDNIIQGCSSFDILLFNRDVSSYKNKVDRKVPRQDTNPKKLLCNPKKRIV